MGFGGWYLAFMTSALPPRSSAEHAGLATAGAPGREPLESVLERTVEALQAKFPHYTGVYIYWLDGDTLVLRSFRGRPTEHVRIPVGQGICGAAITAKDTVVVPDVNADPRYLACFLNTAAEIVVPIMKTGAAVAEIDIDSDTRDAFTADDRRFLAWVAERLAAIL